MKNGFSFRNKYLRITIRTITGLMFLGSGISGLMAGHDMHGVPAAMVPVSQQLWDMGIFQMIKVTEIVAGLMLVTGFVPALGLLMLAPICVGILVFDSNVAPEYLTAGVVVTVLVGYLGYAYFDKYRAIFSRA